MDKIQQKKVNNNNRKRGARFEKKIADMLGMDVVPYSGSNARFGYGDVRNDKWLIECKNITSKNSKITIQILWINKNRERSDAVNKLSCIAWMENGKSDKFIIMEYKDFMSTGLEPDYSYRLNIGSHNTKNIIVHMDSYYIKDIKKGLIIEIISCNVSYFMMNIDRFKEIV